MTKTELENKHISELHSLAAKAGIERYRMLPRAELIAKLADGDSGPSQSSPARESRPSGEQRDRPPRRRRRRSGPKADSAGEGRPSGGGREPRAPRERAESAAEPPAAPAPPPAAAAPTSSASEASPRPRRRRRRRFGRRGKQGVTLQGLLLPPGGRQALLAAETREACTALLRGIAADLSEESKGLDPVALLIDPTPEELADWRRDAPRAEIVAAGQPRHASDALAQAKTRADSGEDVILLVDSLTRLGDAYDDADAAKEFFDAAGGNLTVVAAVERPSA
ncbi:MAG TPA: Rho termination factor N-terminal domain-containing protein [Solirubrobacterales bacterium]|nr:Rho termination factor N-terminal domain-containing protein [Solirubrobacterales bacterium]